MKQFLKHIIKNLLGIFNLEILRIQGKGIPRTKMAHVLDYISALGFKAQTVIDVGAAYGTFELYDRFPTAKHILIEPLIEFENDLKHISYKYNAEYILATAGDKIGNVTINVHLDLVGSSIFKEIEGSYVDGVSRVVPMVTIDSICNKKHLKGPYLVKIDSQGAELLILEGAKSVLNDTEVIILEVSLFHAILGCPLIYDVISYMKRCGFVVYDIFGFNYRPLDKALCQVDMVFVKEEGMFRKDHSFATLEQRKKQFENTKRK